jgi:TPR repeat protein
MGVFYYQGFGVGVNIDKAIEFLTRAEKYGNG